MPIKHLYFFNPSAAFIERGKSTFEKYGLVPRSMEGYKTVIEISPEQSALLYNNAVYEHTDAYFLVRGRGSEVKESFMLALVTELLYQENVPFTSPINRFHTSSSAKMTQLIRFKKHKLLFPRSFIGRSEGFLANREYMLERISFPCVIKTLGANGKKVWKVDSERELEERILQISNAEEPDNVFAIQELIPNVFDMRVIVFEDTVIGAFKRIGQNGFHNNISKGGIGETVTLTDEEREVAVRACKACEIDFGGVDIVRTPKGPVLFEVNRKAGFTGEQGFESITGIDIVDTLARLIAAKYQTKNEK